MKFLALIAKRLIYTILMNMIRFRYYSYLWQLGSIFTKQILKFKEKQLLIKLLYEHV